MLNPAPWNVNDIERIGYCSPDGLPIHLTTDVFSTFSLPCFSSILRIFFAKPQHDIPLSHSIPFVLGVMHRTSDVFAFPAR